jgi:hypothetical protein
MDIYSVDIVTLSDTSLLILDDDAVFRTRLGKALQRGIETLGNYRAARFLGGFIQLRAFGAQYAGQGQQCFSARRWGAWNPRGQIQRQAQGLFQGGGVWCQARAGFFLALDVQGGRDIAALEDLPRRVAQRGFHRVKAIGQAQPQIQAAPIDAAHFPQEGSAIGQGAISTGETGHGCKLGHAPFLPQEE